MAESWGENDKAVSDASWGANDKPVNGGAKDPSLTDRAVYGFKRMVGATKTALTDDPNQVGQILADQNANAPKQSAAAERMQQEIKPYQDTYQSSTGLDAVKSFGALGLKRAGQFISEPVETAKSIAEQVPNSLPGMAGGAAGAKAGAALGSLVGPAGTAVGAVAGGVLGGLAGGYLTEKGSSIQEQVQKKAAEAGVNQTDATGLAGVYRANQADIDQSAALKGVGTAGTDAVLNVLTMGLSGAGRRALSNEIASTYKAVKTGGISAADGAKQLAALEARQAAQNTLGSKALRGAGVVAGEMGGEALSEAAGQKLAYGSVDPLEVIDEGLLGFGQGAAMGLASGAVNKIAGTPEAGGIDSQLKDLRSAVDAKQTPSAPTDQTGLGAVPPAAPPRLEHNPMAGTHTVFPDGSIVLNSDSSNGAKTVRDMQRAQRLENAADPFFGDPAPTPSQSMGLQPTAGPSLANAAILSVDAGLHQAAAAEADPYNAPLSALGQELARTNQRLRQEADALGLDTDGLHGDAARMTDGKPHEDYLQAANDQLRKAMKAAKELPDEGQRSTSETPAAGGEAASPDAKAGKAPAGDVAGPVGAGAVRLPADRVGEHGQRPAGTDSGNLPGAVATQGKAGKNGKTPADGQPTTGPAQIQDAGVAGGFDPVAFDKERDDRIKASKAAGNKHLDDLPAYVESMRGKHVYYAHDTKVIGVVRTVDNHGNVYVNWSDDYSAKKELASPMKDGKKTVMQTSLGPSDLKDYVVGTPPKQSSQPQGAPADVPKSQELGTQASQAPGAQGAAQAGTAVGSIDDAAHQAATSPNNALAQPTDGQKKAGNYAKGHVNLNGLDLAIENPAGSVRSGKDKSGKAWSNTLQHHYGYIKGTVGNDKDHVDLFVKPETPLDYSGTVFVIDQQHPHNGKFDEHKVMVGFANQADAKKAYFANYAKGWKGMSAITPMTFDAFKAWVKDGAKNTPVSKDPAVSTQPQGATSEPQADQAQQAEAQRPQEPAAAAEPVATANPKIKAALDKKNGLGAQLAALNAELERQGAVQNANTRAQRDAIRKQIAEQDFPEILKAVDGNIDTAEGLNSAFKYAGDEPKAKTIERILKKRGITPEYQKRWSERLMEGQQAGTKPESVVKVPEAISTAIEDQLRKQKQRVMRRRNEESAPGLNLEQKAAAQTKTKAAEANLRTMRTSIFDAEDAAVKAIETGKASEFEKHADLFPAANDAIRAMLGQNDELDAETQAYESGLTAQTRADDVKKLVDAAKKQAKEPAPGTRINGSAERSAADRLSKLVDVMPSVMKPRANGARSQIKGVIEQLRKDQTGVSITQILETASQNFLSDGHAPFSEVVDEVIESLSGQGQENDGKAKKTEAISKDGEPTAKQIAAIGSITIEFQTEDGITPLTVNAASILKDIDERLDALEMVKRCLG